MIVLDAHAALAFLKREPAADEVEDLLIRDGGGQLTAAGLTEVVDHLVRVVGADPDDAVLDVTQLRLDHAIPIDAELGRRAGLLRGEHYHRRTRAVSLADCLVAAAALTLDRPVATADPHLLDLCHDEGIATHPLAASDGSRWAPGS